MAHHNREQDDAAYNNVPLSSSTLRNLDEKTKKNIGGHTGGTWAPTSPIVIGGAGLQLLGPSTLPSATITTSPGKHITHGRLDADDYITLASSHLGESRWAEGCCDTFVASSRSTVALQTSVASGIIAAAQPRVPGARFFMPVRVHHGATVSSFILAFVIVYAHATVPVVAPKMRVVRIDAAGNVEPLRQNATDTDADGFMNILSSGSTLSTYEGGHIEQLFIYNPDRADRTTVDASKYVYMAEIVEESGVGAFSNSASPNNGNLYFAIETWLGDIHHLGPQ